MQDLVEVGVSMAMRGAREYLDRHGLTAEPEALRECLKAWLKLQMPVALRDAREALACHMDQVAEATFTASMVQAGIEAAKEAGFPKVRLRYQIAEEERSRAYRESEFAQDFEHQP